MLQKSMWMLHNMPVASLCFIRMLQVFHLDVAKVDLDVAYVLQRLHTCFKFFRCFAGFQTYVYKYFSYFKRMVQVFYLNVA
jgi:hypothetical protein